MHLDLLDILACPQCREALEPVDVAASDVIEEGALRCRGCGSRYPVVRGIPRFVPAENYASSFGFQWNLFPRTQLDSSSGLPITKQRFFASTGWTEEELKGKRVLDVGCGSGRFAEVALATGARVVAFDYSSSVDACRDNFGANEQLDLLQADLYSLPFRDGVFEYVYCLGMLQNTPDPERAFQSVLAPLQPGGKIAVDVYPKNWLNVFWPKYWLRPLTRRMRHDRLLRLIQRLMPMLLAISRTLGRVPRIGRKLRFLVPVANYEGIYPLNEEQLHQWAVLDTFDMLSPAHDHPQSAATMRGWGVAAGLRNGEVLKPGHMVLRGEKAGD
ncbi:MAG TPA: methyltransferase domain-containing protein [Thermoanaerobaculia bacterium]|jgi:SAM-dependent methyltransferase|nr:methyltransferase domain-containing protein [Thermoanaerobaculia bacterium]